MPDMHGVEGQTLVANGNQASENGVLHDAMMTKYGDDRKDVTRPEHSPDAKAEEYWRGMSPYSQLERPSHARMSEADSSISVKTESDTSSLRSPTSPTYERSHSYGSLEGTPYLNPLPSLANLARSPASSFHNCLVSAAAGNAAMRVTSGGFGVKQQDQMTPDRGNGLRDVYYCHLCTFVGQTKDDFDEHMNTHFEHQCPNCDYTSRTEGRLKRHIKDFHSNPDDPENRREHGKPKTMRCRQCNYATQDKYEFWNHQRTHIKDDKMLQCPKCPFVTEYKHHLEYHLRNHFGSKPYKCERCNYSCVNKSMLNSHMKSHTNVYQYRCADCTYATKYCHSLKLHLKKYNHNAATVLNPDGSLPTDGSGDFELVSKRGPPRGPRGPRKDKSPPPGFTPSMPQPPPQLPMPGFMPGMPPALWPMMPGKSMFSSNGFQTPPPLLSLPGMPPLCLGMPSPMSSLEGMRQFEMMADDGPGPIPCYLCEYSTGSQQKLLCHLLKVHRVDHQELLHIYANPLHASQPEIKDLSMEMNHMFSVAHSTSSPLVEPPKSSPKMRHQVEGEEFPKSGLAVGLAADIEAESKQSRECPLDLTKSSVSDDGRRLAEEALQMQAKRKMEDCASSSDGELNDPALCDGATPRKRSRKGKAYKLDTLCMKLQEKCCSPPPEGYESDVYGSEFDESSPDSDRPPISTPADRLNHSANEDPKVAFEKLQKNLAELSGAVTMKALNGDVLKTDKDEGKDSGNEDHNSTDNSGNSDNSDHVKENSEDLKISPSDSANMFEDVTDPKKLLQVSRRLEPHFAKTLGDIAEENIAMGNFECCHCGIAFRDCVMYTVHMGYHGYKDPFKCNMCGHQADNKVEFFLHIARAAHD